MNAEDSPPNSDLRPLTSGHIPIIAMTAHALPGDREKFIDVGMDDYIAKPVDPQALADLLKRWLRTEGGGDGGLKSGVGGRRAGGGGQGSGVWGHVSKVDGRPPVFEMEALLRRLLGDLDLATEVMEGFTNDVPRQIQALGGFLESGDASAAERQAHTIKGASANVSAERLRKAAYEVEKTVRDGDLARARSLMTELEGQFTLVKEAMTHEIERRRG